MKKRLKSYYRQKKLTKAHVSPPKKNKIEFLMVIDFEATCEENNDRYKHEIIEFPVILVNLENNKVVSYFNLGWVAGLWCLTPLLTIFQLSWQSVLLVEEVGVPRENHRPATSR